MIGKLARLAYRSSARDVVVLAKRRLGVEAGALTKRAIPPTEGFLRSPTYAEYMGRYLPYGGAFDLHEAQNETRNFRFRHHEVAHELGVFRWRGLQKHLSTVLSLVGSADALVADLGGAAGPLGFGSHVVDLLAEDVWGRPVRYRSLSELPRAPDVVFTSHMLEHVPALDDLLAEVKRHLRPGGHFLVHLPSFYCERWRAGAHRSARYQDHVWTFGIGAAPQELPLDAYVDVQDKLSKSFELQLLEYCGDDSIFVHAIKSQGA